MTFFLTLAFMFMVFWRPQEWLLPWLYGWPLLDAVVYLGVLSLFIEAQQGTIRFPRRAPQVFLLLGLWFAAIMSQIVHTYFGGMVDSMIEVFKFCFFTLLLLCVIDRPQRLRAMAVVFVAMACVMSFHALMQQRVGAGFAGARPIWIPSIGGNPPYLRSRFFGIFADPNDLAQILVTAMPLALAIPRRLTAFSFIACAAVIGFLYMGYATTYSRGGMVALVATVGLGIVMLMPVRWTPMLVGVGLVLGLVACSTRAGAMLDASARGRLEFWGYGNQAFKRNPLFGIGYNMFWQVGGGRPAHNAFVTCYTELGILGYWMWFNLLLLGVVGGHRTRVALRHTDTVEGKYLRRFSALAVVAMGGFAASAYFLSRTFVFPLFFLIAMLNVIPFVAEQELPEDSPVLIAPRRDVFLVGSVGSVLSIVYIYISILLLNRVAHG